MQTPSNDFSFNTSPKPKVMTSEPNANTSALDKSPVYSPLGTSAYEVHIMSNPKLPDAVLGDHVQSCWEC